MKNNLKHTGVISFRKGKNSIFHNTAVLCLLLAIVFPLQSWGQQTKLTINMKNEKVQKILDEIQTKSNYKLFL